MKRQIAILTGQHQLVENKAQYAEGGPHKEEQPERLEGWCIVVWQSDHRPLPLHVLQHQGRHDSGDPHRLDGQKGVAKLRPHLLHHEQDPRQRCIEGRSQTARRTGCQQGVAMLLGQPEDISHHLAEVAADLHRRPFPSQHHAGAQGTHPAEELDRQHPPPPHWTQVLHRPLYFGNAGASGLGGKSMSQEVTDTPQHGAEAKAKQAELPPGAISQQGEPLLCQPVHA